VGGAATPDPEVEPTVLVFDDISSLVDSLLVPEAGHPLGVGDQETGGGGRLEDAEPVRIPSIEVDDDDHLAADDDVISDEDRTRYGLLLDRAAERGLLEPADYEVRLRALAEATTTEEMVEIVAELPAFTPPPARAIAARSRRSGRTSTAAPGPGRPETERRRKALWALLVLLVVVAMASLVILALSVERLSRTRGSIGPSAPVATRPVSALRL